MDYFVPLPGTVAPSFTGSTLVLPQPSLSSVAQLAADLLVHNYRLELVGYLGVPDYVPAVGGRDALPGEEEDREGLSLGTEVYTTPSRSLTVVLPRSPVIRARKAHHLAAMEAFVAAGGFKEVLIVAGVDAAGRGDEALNVPTPLRHLLPLSSSSSSSNAPPSSSPLIASLRALSPPFPSHSTSSLPALPHAGLTRALLSAVSSSSAPVPTAALLAYTAEGASSSLAHALASALSYALRAPLAEVASRVELLPTEGESAEGQEPPREVRWKEPRSWERGLMGVELERGAGREMFS